MHIEHLYHCSPTLNGYPNTFHECIEQKSVIELLIPISTFGAILPQYIVTIVTLHAAINLSLVSRTAAM